MRNPRMRSAAVVLFMTSLGSAGVLWACSDDSGNGGTTTPDGSTDAPTGTLDSGVDARVDTGVDTGIDAPSGDSGVDAGPKITEVVAASAFIEISNRFVFGFFRKDDQIIHDEAVTNCVAVIYTNEKPFSPSGTMTVSSDHVGKDGGIPAALALQPAPVDYLEYLGDPPGPVLFPINTAMNVQIEVAGLGPQLPTLPVTTLRTPGFGELAIAAPRLDGGAVVIRSTEDYVLTWTPPGPDAGTGAKVIARLFFVVGPAKQADLFCTADATAGRVALPTSLLGAIKQRVSPAAPVPGSILQVRLGDFKEVRVGDNSYLVDLNSENGTTFMDAAEITLD